MLVIGMSFLEKLGQDTMHWFTTTGIHIAIIIAITVVVIRLVIAALERWKKIMIDRNGVDVSERDRRVITITGILTKLLWGVGLGIAVVTILKELGIDAIWLSPIYQSPMHDFRSEERRVGKECRSRWSPYH